MEKKKSTVATVLLLISVIIFGALVGYIYIQKIETDKKIDDLELKIFQKQEIKEELEEKQEEENLVTELALGKYEVTEHIEDECGISYGEVGVTLDRNNLCYIYEGYGSGHIGTYLIENNKLICNTIIIRGEEGGLAYFEQNIIFEFEIISKDEIKLVNVLKDSKASYNDIALKYGMTYKLKDGDFKVLIEND